MISYTELDEAWGQVSPVPRQLTLPNGKAYLFSYYNNSAGEIQQITLPTGATIGYTYSDFQQIKAAALGSPNSIVGGRAVVSRTVTVNGTASTWTYALGNTSTVTDPLGNVATHNWEYLSVSLGGSNVVDSPTMYESSATYADSTGHVLRSESNTYGYEYDPVNNSIANARLTGKTTTLDNGQVTQVTTTYDTFTYPCYLGSPYCPATATNLNPIQVNEYDYGQGSAGALLRTTSTTYQGFSIGGTTISKPHIVTVYNGSGGQVSQTTYEYDNYAHTNQPMQASGAVQHAATYETSYTNRANVTAVSKWRNTDGALLTTANQYDDAGNLLSEVDPLGYKTSYSYADSWGNATCAPSGQGRLYRTATTNAAGQTSQATFNSCTGTVTSTTDANSKTTNVSYDLLNRIVQTSYPDSGLKTFCFSDNPSSSCYSSSVWSATETDKITSSINLVKTNIFDGLGRTVHSELVSDPEGISTTDTTYDGDGRVLQTSNPYRSGDTERWTTNTYDGIGRITAVTKTDGSIARTAYVGNTVTSTDEAGKTRETVTDALGRLTTVYENPGGLNYETDYSYDALGDVTQVTQKGGSASSSNWRVRTFSYNSLAELLCSANPEIGSPLSSTPTCPNPDSGTYTSGTIRYQYDNDGNLASKFAPAENQQSTSTVTTTYNYDNLNRLTATTYSDATPTVRYGYDGVAPTGCTLPTPSPSATNLIGRMSGMCDGSGATAWSYDQVGRTTVEARRIVTATDQISYSYTYNGIVNQVTYPLAGGTTPFILNYNVNAAGRVYSAVSGTRTFAQVQSTWADGSAHSYQYGANIQFTDTYNVRLQPLTLTATQISPSNTLMSKTYDFHSGSAADNGVLWAVTDGIDSLGLNRPNGSVQYNYDAMNRVISAQTLGTSCTSVNGGTLNWGDSFTVDPWGNLTGKTVTLCSAETLSTSVNTQNRLAAATYDSAGNAIAYNGMNFTFDAEGRLTAAGGTSYLYDGSGQRVEKPGKLYWNGTSSAALAETSATDTNPTLYIFFNGKRIGRIDPGTTTPKYYLDDNVGSTALVTDYLGNPLSESLFYPYGGEQQIMTGDSNNYKFTGKERDPESGLDDFGARYYTSNLGRFMSPDWDAKPTAVPYASFGDPQTLNLYSYVENQPLNRVDADGHSPNPGNIMNFWTELGEQGDWSLQVLGSWHAYCLGSGPMVGILGENDSGGEYAFEVEDATQEQMREAQQDGVSQAQQQSSSTTTVTLNNRQANIPGGGALDAIGIDHQWITFDGVSVGMGTAQGVPQSDAPGVQTQVVDHTGQVATSTQTFTGVDSAALSTYTKVGTPTGRWIPGVNDCNTWAYNVIHQSTPHDIYDRAPVVTKNGVIPGHVEYHNVVVYADGSIHSPGGQ